MIRMLRLDNAGQIGVPYRHFRALSVNEGGRYFTLWISPFFTGLRFRIYLFGWVFSIGRPR